ETETDPLGNTTSYTYTETGLLEATVDPLGRVTTRGYDDAGRLTTLTNPDSSTWGYEYDAAGRLTKTIDPLGHWTVQTYDTAGRLVAEIVDADNPALPGTERHQITAYGYDAARRQTTVTIDPGPSPK